MRAVSRYGPMRDLTRSEPHGCCSQSPRHGSCLWGSMCFSTQDFSPGSTLSQARSYSGPKKPSAESRSAIWPSWFSRWPSTGSFAGLAFGERSRDSDMGLRPARSCGGAFAVGLYSISTVPLPLLAGWWIGQTIELGLAGAVLGSAANRVRLRRIWVVVAVAVLACIAGTIILQSLGLAPPMKIVR